MAVFFTDETKKKCFTEMILRTQGLSMSSHVTVIMALLIDKKKLDAKQTG